MPEQVGGGAAPSGEQVDQPERYAYRPALDGVRAVAVTAVVLFHFGVGTVGGGFLGVDVFLALSGFLITTLLLREFASSERISVGAFYGRRARRLLPALLVLLATIAVYGQLVADEIQLIKLRGDTLASLLYVANWRFIFEGAGYFEQFASPSPVNHLWSLAIEEQWYLVWPLAVMGLLAVVGPPVGRQRSVWLGVTVSLAATSALLMALLVDDTNVNRVYYGTDTRAQTLLIGAALAVAFHGRVLSRGAQRRLDDLGLVGLLGCLAMFALVDDTHIWMYQGGFALIAIFSVLLIAGAAGPSRGWTSSLLSVPPLPQLGRISYGVYLWHWPVAVYLDEARTNLSGVSLFITRVAVTLLISIASYQLVERPIRQRRWPARQTVIAAATGMLLSAAIILTTIPTKPSPETLVVTPEPATTPAGATLQRILVAGDSVGLSLALGDWAGALPGPAALGDAITFGCGLPIENPPGCTGIFRKWRERVAGFNPDVTVLVLGRWEIYDRDIGERTLKFGSSEDRDWLLKQLAHALRIFTSRGGRVVLFTVPCFNGQALNVAGESNRFGSPSGTREDIAWLNGVLREAAADAGPAVAVIDYGNYVCPNGRDRSEIDGIRVRSDGIHLTTEGASLVWRWLASQLSLSRTGTAG